MSKLRRNHGKTHKITMKLLYLFAENNLIPLWWIYMNKGKLCWSNLSKSCRNDVHDKKSCKSNPKIMHKWTTVNTSKPCRTLLCFKVRLFGPPAVAFKKGKAKPFFFLKWNLRCIYMWNKSLPPYTPHCISPKKNYKRKGLPRRPTLLTF